MIEKKVESVEIKDCSVDLHRLATEPQPDVGADSGKLNPIKIIEYLIKSVFNPEHWYPARFSTDPDIKAYYAALEEETAIFEIGYHVYHRFKHVPRIRNGAPIKYLHFLCRFSGTVKDLSDLANTFPELMEDDHGDICDLAARQVRADGADALVAPSVRNRPHGRCVAVFKEKTLTPLRIEQNVVFFLKNNTSKVKYEIRPYKEYSEDW